jgi:hypothetical protein
MKKKFLLSYGANFNIRQWKVQANVMARALGAIQSWGVAVFRCTGLFLEA